MKESNFTLLFSFILMFAGFIVDDNTRSIAAMIMAFCLVLVSSICRAIEKNGANK